VRRRITEAIVGVTGLVLLMLGFPLAAAVHQSIVDGEVTDLQGTAARTLAELDVPLDRTQLLAVSRDPDVPPSFSVYDASGTLIFGPGPAAADPVVRRALAGDPGTSRNGRIEVSTPITAGTSDQVIGALALRKSLGRANHRVLTAWAIMAAAGLGALAFGLVVASRVAARLSRPVTDLAARASTIGAGGPLAAPPASGIAEIDTLAAALAASSARVSDALDRERRFSADVSHQLRTPMTGLRLQVETARASGDVEALEPALRDLDRLEQTVDHLLAFARDAMPASATARLDEAADRAAARWTARVTAAGRHITAEPGPPTCVRAAPASLDQVLDVLIDNALHHGRGDIVVCQRPVAGAGALDVVDEGRDLVPEPFETIFERGRGDHNGIGLALARSIAVAEGGRLLFTRGEPTTFSLVLLAAGDDGTPTGG